MKFDLKLHAYAEQELEYRFYNLINDSLSGPVFDRLVTINPSTGLHEHLTIELDDQIEDQLNVHLQVQRKKFYG